MRIPIYFIAALSLIFGVSVQAEPTFANLAVLFAKGYFKEHVPQDAPLEDCVEFLNRQGVYFSMFDLIDSSVKVTQEDFAKVIGQSTLLFLGEAEMEKGCVKRPDEIVTWVDYCLLNDVDLRTLWSGFLKRTENRSLPEVKKFFGGTL